MTAPAHNRHTIRLPGYDYTQPGAYFFTIVTRGRECALGSDVDGNVILSSQGIIVQNSWHDLPQHFQLVMLDEFVIMPNHIHGFIMIMDDDRAKPGVMEIDCRGDASGMLRVGLLVTPFPDAAPLPHGTQPASLGAILQNFKSVSTRRINGMQNTPGQPFWQRNYYEHVIRNESELQQIRQYIRDNPMRWSQDEENPQKKLEGNTPTLTRTPPLYQLDTGHIVNVVRK